MSGGVDQEDAVRRAEADVLLGVLRQARMERGSDAFIELACQRARELVGADVVAVLTRAMDGGYLWLGISGNRTDVITHQSRALGRGPSVTAIAEERVVVFRRDGL